MTKLTVVYLKDTGNVLAALTRADPPAAGEPVSALVGAGLPIGLTAGIPAGIVVPAAKLDAVTVDDQPGVVLDPSSFLVVVDPQKKQPPAVTGAGVAGSTVNLAISKGLGVTVAVANVPSVASLAVVVVLQKAAPPGPAPSIIVASVPVNSLRVVAPGGGFNIGDTWNMYAFVQSLGLTYKLSYSVKP